MTKNKEKIGSKERGREKEGESKKIDSKVLLVERSSIKRCQTRSEILLNGEDTLREVSRKRGRK